MKTLGPISKVDLQLFRLIYLFPLILVFDPLTTRRSYFKK